MSLFPCPDCGNRISTKAKDCPKCGLVITPKMVAKFKEDEAQAVRYGTIGCIAIVVAVVIVGIISNEGNRTDENFNPPDAPETTFSQEWHEGGTLHHATMREWSAASHRNKLATAADILTTLLRVDGIDVSQIDVDAQLRPAAEGLVRRMDEFNSDGSSDGRTVSEVAATLHVLIKNRHFK